MKLIRGGRFGIVLLAASAAAGAAQAGGFAVREQSAVHQGASFAGNGVGPVISSQYWNPAALGHAGYGINTESGYAILFTQSDFTATGGTALGAFPGADLTTDSGGWALVPSSYGSYRISDSLVLGYAFNAPFGLGSEPDTNSWVGAVHGRSAKLTTYNFNPNLSYKVAPGFHIGAGLQFEYASLRFKFGAGSPAAPNAVLDIDDTIGLGYTLGAMWQMGPQTTMGLGFRSSITHDFSGDLFVVGAPSVTNGTAAAELELPEMVTLSLRHAFSQQLRGMATIEWTNWSRLDSVPVMCTSLALAPPCASGATLGTLDTHWDDGWFYSVGFEYDYQPGLTFRGGLAYEKSPAQTPDQRLFQVPDSDRIWLSGGVSYKLFENTTLDFAYTHIFLEDAEVSRGTLVNPALTLTADREGSVDIFTVGYRMRWGGGEPLK